MSFPPPCVSCRSSLCALRRILSVFSHLCSVFLPSVNVLVICPSFIIFFAVEVVFQLSLSSFVSFTCHQVNSFAASYLSPGLLSLHSVGFSIMVL